MKYRIIAAVVLMISAIMVISFKGTTTQKTKSSSTFEPVAVIELFTSQGCSSCPPADKLLAQTIEDSYAGNRNIFALSFHVDCWNRLGWTDPFSKVEFSQRQNDYARSLHIDGPYTPQMIVNGVYEFVGSDKNSLTKAILQALETKTTTKFLTLETVFDKDNTIKVNYRILETLPGYTVNVAVVSVHEVTSVKRGENSGVTLHNDNVVKQFATVAASASGEITFKDIPKQANNKIAIIAFLQEKETRRITAAAMAKIPD